MATYTRDITFAVALDERMMNMSDKVNTMNDIDNQYIEHMKDCIPCKIEEIITKIVFSKHKNNINTDKYDTIEEYLLELDEVTKNINDRNYTEVVELVANKYEEYTFKYSNTFDAVFNYAMNMSEDEKEYPCNAPENNIEFYGEYIDRYSSLLTKLQYTTM